jgi:magnesium-transporting ATPase (P-type)
MVMVMVTGDGRPTAEAVAGALGIEAEDVSLRLARTTPLELTPDSDPGH